MLIQVRLVFSHLVKLDEVYQAEYAGLKPRSETTIQVFASIVA